MLTGEYSLLCSLYKLFGLSHTNKAARFGKSAPTSRPLLFHQAATANNPERVIIQYARRAFTGYWGLPRSSHLPPITEAQAEALDALHFTAQKHALALEFQSGDIQFINNLSILHGRGAFRDTPDKQ